MVNGNYCSVSLHFGLNHSLSLFNLADSPPVTVTATDRQDVASNTATITTAVSSLIF